jgi:hypothetical protein
MTVLSFITHTYLKSLPLKASLGNNKKVVNGIISMRRP